jgi:hypothetical protein
VLSLRRDETTGGGLTRIARETIDLAIADLIDSKPDIHEARKRLKEIRAVLRLGHFMLDSDFASLNRRFRDAARQLAATREADALIEIVEALRASARDPIEKRALTRVRRIFSEDRVAEPDRLDIAAQLANARDELSFAEGSFARGLRKTYRDGRRCFRTARDRRTAESIHEWRKRVKYLWYHAQILAPPRRSSRCLRAGRGSRRGQAPLRPEDVGAHRHARRAQTHRNRDRHLRQGLVRLRRGSPRVERSDGPLLARMDWRAMIRRSWA